MWGTWFTWCFVALTSNITPCAIVIYCHYLGWLMVVAFYTLMLADCSPFSRLLERLWGINWNGSTRSWGEPRTCCNLLEPDSTQFVGPVGEPHSMEKSSQHWEATCPGTSTLWNILWNILWNMLWNIFWNMLWNILNIWSPHWVLNGNIGMNQYEYVGCAKALLVRQCLQVHGWAGGRTDACSWGSMGDQVQDSVYM